ncbi:MAG: hypothetical protein ACJAWZ_001842 [Paracoccaceae bacterium]|jgi:hypothetical protein
MSGREPRLGACDGHGNPPIFGGGQSQNLHGRVQILGAGYAVDAPLPGNNLPSNHESNVRAFMALGPHPLRVEVFTP